MFRSRIYPKIATILENWAVGILKYFAVIFLKMWYDK